MQISYADFLGAKPQKDVFDTIDDKVIELEAKGIKTIDLGVGDPAKSNPPPQYVIDALSKCANQHKLSGYPGYRGTKQYCQTCCDYMNREFDVNLDPETEVVATIGSKEAVFHFPKIFVNPGDIVICPNPGYPPFYQGTLATNGIPYYAPLYEKNNFLIDFAAIPNEIAQKAKLIWINYPNSPTGVMAPRDWLKQLVAWAHANNIIIAADEGAYIELYYDKKPTSILEITKEGVVAFYSLSKRNNMTSYRVGFAAGDQAIIEGILMLKNRLDNGVPQFIQEVASLALNDVEYVNNLRQKYKQKRELIINAFQEKNFPKTKSDSTFFLWQKAPQGMDGDDLAIKLLELGIVVMPGSALTQTAEGENPGKNYIRIALMPTLKNIALAAQRIREASNLEF